MLEIDVDTDRWASDHCRSGVTEATIKLVLVKAIKTMLLPYIFKVVSSDCIEQKGVRK
jgi:hypothetical protein